MESVPETERLESFTSFPRPALRIQSPSSPLTYPRSPGGPISPLSLEPAKRPTNLRRSTDPTHSPRSSPVWTQPVNPSQSTLSLSSTMDPLPYRPRNASPLTLGANNQSRRAVLGHGRSKSHLGFAMPRPHSLHGSPYSGSPTSSPQRVRVPKRNPDDCFPSSPIRTSVLENSPRRNRDRSSSPSASMLPFPSMNSAQVFGTSPLGSSPMGPSPLAAAAQITMSRVRPSSPPRSHPSSSLMTSPMSLGRRSLDSNINVGGAGTSAITMGFNNYTYSTNFSNSSIPSLSNSSIPSTPTSTRSRSPSLSSLETIEDTPDAEDAAVEETLKEASELAARKEAVVAEIKSTKGARAFRDKRKRWSVCGAERRGDLDLETIWED